MWEEKPEKKKLSLINLIDKTLDITLSNVLNSDSNEKKWNFISTRGIK